MIELNFTLIIQLVIVLTLMGILTQILFKPFLGVLQERRNRIEGAEKRAKDLQQQAEELIERYRGRLPPDRRKGRGSGMKSAKRVWPQKRRSFRRRWTRPTSSSRK